MQPMDSATPVARNLRSVDKGIEYRRYFTDGLDGLTPFGTVEWARRDVTVGDFHQSDVEAPTSWSDQAVGVVAKLYFATVDGVKEDSVKQVIERVVFAIVEGMREHGYFDSPDQAIVFGDELAYAILHQYLTFNTPVWLNLGVPGRDPYCAACYLLSTEDHMVGPDSITDWWAKEAMIFKSGAGSGINLSTLRGSMEPLSTGGTASGPVAYMRPADAGAGTLKSGGAHRRAAKFVRLDDDHPDIKDFIDTKLREDQRMRALQAAGFDLDPTTIEGERLIAECTSFQNANISVGVHDVFMEIALGERGDTHWPLVARTTQQAVEYVEASELLNQIADAAWACGDPGVQFHDTINDWHTTPSLGEITTSNPCGETLLNDDSSCNIASLNVAKYLDKRGFDIDGFCHHIDVLVTAMDAICSFSKLPTERIERNTRELRQLGMGYANLGAALMVKGLPYDSDEGRDFAAAITALMTGHAYKRSAHLAEHLGAFEHWGDNSDAMMRVIGKHIDHITPFQVGNIWDRARIEWAEAQSLGPMFGYRNSQVTLVAPTGTTSFMLGCDTTGVEPAFSLLTHKSLAGGGKMKMVNGSVERALQALGYSENSVAFINRRVIEGGSIFGHPLLGEHEAVFQTSVGENPISPMGHVKMVAAVQPFLSQGVSKTVNMPEWSTPEDVRDIYTGAWHLGLKSISIYRDNSKATQVLNSKPRSQDPAPSLLDPNDGIITKAQAEALVDGPRAQPQRRRMPRQRDARIIKFSIDGHEGYLHTGMYESGELGEIFLSGIGKDGSTLRGICDAFATDFSIALQYGVPLETLVCKHAHVAFPPSGPTGDPDVPTASSIVDYIGRKLAAMFLPADICEELGVLSPEVKRRMSERLDHSASAPASTYVKPELELSNVDMGVGSSLSSPVSVLVGGVLPVAGQGSPIAAAMATGSLNGNHVMAPDIGEACRQCGSNMQRTGTCWSCPTCFATTGCG